MSTPNAPGPSQPNDPLPSSRQRSSANRNGAFVGDNAAQANEFVRITPLGASTGHPISLLQELIQNRDILSALVTRLLRLRYKGSAIGILWSIVPPIVQVFVLTVVIGKIMGAGPPNMSAFMFCAFLPWIFVQSALMDGSSSVLEQLPLVKKAYFPRELLPIATIISNLIHFSAALVVFLIYRYLVTTVFLGWPGLPPHEIIMLPFVVLDMVILTTGLSLMLSAWTTFYEDVKYIVSTTLQLMFYALPIIYFSENVFVSVAGKTTHLRKLLGFVYLANPFAWIVTAFKQMFFQIQVVSNKGGVPVPMAPFNYKFYALTTFTSIVVYLIGYYQFQRWKWKFVERP